MPSPSNAKANIVLRPVDRDRIRKIGRILEDAGVVDDARRTFVLRVALVALERAKPEEIIKFARAVLREDPES